MNGQAAATGRSPDVPPVAARPEYRRELHNWFKTSAPSLADAYEGAVRLMETPGFPCRAHLIAHLVRDICNRIPDIRGSVKRTRVKYEAELDGLSKIWRDSTKFPITDYRPTTVENEAGENVSIPRKAAVAVEALLLKHRNRQTNRDVIRILFSLIGEVSPEERASLEPIVTAFSRTHDWFEAKTHLGNGPMEEPDEADLVARFELFEQLALSIFRSFFRTVDEIDELLREANAKSN